MDNELRDILNELESDATSVARTSTKSEVITTQIAPDISQELLELFKERWHGISERNKDYRNGLINFIKFLETIVYDPNKKSSRVCIEQLGGAWRTLLESNANELKSLDAISKLLAAGKGTGLLIKDVEMGDDEDELHKLLEGSDLDEN